MTKERKKLNKEIGDFVTTTAILFFINLMTSPNYWWFIWVIGFWGAALIGKYVVLELNDKDEDYEEDDCDYDELELEPLEDYRRAKPRRNWNERDMV